MNRPTLVVRSGNCVAVPMCDVIQIVMEYLDMEQGVYDTVIRNDDGFPVLIIERLDKTERGELEQ